MAKLEWGIKRICPNCGARYYDMRKDPPTCPSCATVFDPEALLKSRRARPLPVEDTKKAPVVAEDDEEATTGDEERELEGDEDLETTESDIDVEEIEEDEVSEEVGEDEEDVLLEDAEELGDEDDMGEVVDVEGDEDR